MAAALPPSFLDPLFSLSLMEDSELRQLVLEILHNITDRHDNRAKLRGIRYDREAASANVHAHTRVCEHNERVCVFQDYSQRRGVEDQTGKDFQTGCGVHEKGEKKSLHQTLTFLKGFLLWWGLFFFF